MNNLQSFQSIPAVISVTGEDALPYLQSQFSNNLKRPESQAATYGLFLDRKGKVQHDAFALQLGEEAFLLISYHADAETLQSKVEENIIADEVELEDVSAKYKLLTLWGSDEALKNLAPETGCFKQLDDVLIFRGRQVGGLNLDCLIPADQNWCPEGFSLESSKENEALLSRINAGTPAIPQDIGSSDLPHEGGDLSVVAVSYTKGCYLGQEVMARLHAMGQPQRALYRVSFAPQSSAEPLAVYSGEKAIGAVTSHCDGTGLALLKRRYLTEGATLSLKAPGGDALKIESEIFA